MIIVGLTKDGEALQLEGTIAGRVKYDSPIQDVYLTDKMSEVDTFERFYIRTSYDGEWVDTWGLYDKPKQKIDGFDGNQLLRFEKLYNRTHIPIKYLKQLSSLITGRIELKMVRARFKVLSIYSEETPYAVYEKGKFITDLTEEEEKEAYLAILDYVGIRK